MNFTIRISKKKNDLFWVQNALVILIILVITITKDESGRSNSIRLTPFWNGMSLVVVGGIGSSVNILS